MNVANSDNEHSIPEKIYHKYLRLINE
jgi:hypothetical protein